MILFIRTNLESIFSLLLFSVRETIGKSISSKEVKNDTKEEHLDYDKR